MRGRNGLNFKLDSIFFKRLGLPQWDLFLHRFGGMASGSVGLDSCITLNMDSRNKFKVTEPASELSPAKGGPEAARPIYISHFGDIFAALSTKELKFYL
jgi:hypothetical protein